ncbi:MAG: ABC transporter permease [Acidobacteria bacterium RIFCSPLOWO2_12_FULL_67_14b]|nr:MAG: ABC transporter permease [Acidobacteria bacterium RIFCSPLOWO2_12_FULL_67_14b]
MTPADRVRRRAVGSAIVLSVPAVLLLLALFAVPLLRLLALSVEGGSLVAYQRALTNELYLRVIFETFKIAAVVTLLTLALGYPVAYVMATSGRVWQLVGIAFVLLPFWTSILVRTYAWMVMLGRNGVVNRTLIGWGVIDSPLPLLNNLAGVLIGMVHVLLPYMILPVFNAVKKVDPNLVLAAEGLGAPRWRAFLRVTLPLTMNGVAAGVTLVFTLSLGFFITPALLGGGRVVMIANLIEEQVRELLNWAFAGALSAILLALTLAAFWGISRIARTRSA